MPPSTPDTPHPVRYPVWLGLASFVWAPAAWALAALAPQMAFFPLVELLHTALPALTGTLILANLAFSLWALRRRVPVDQLLLVTALQLGLFTALFYQISAHFGAEHYELDRPAKSWDWVQFSLAHALKATDVLDTIEAYGLDVQNVTHRGTYLATLLVVYHIVIELFMLGILWEIVGVWKRHVMNDPARARLIRRTLWLSFGVWLIAWLVSALWLRPWQPNDIPLWLAENVVRVLDFADAMDSYDIHWHQIPRGPWESTLTFICRVWVALGIGLLLNGLARLRKARPRGDRQAVPSFTRVARLGVAGVMLGLFVALSDSLLANDHDPCRALVTAASGEDHERATAALNALRRLGPNAAGMVAPLAEARGRVEPYRRRKITETLGYLGPAAVDVMTDIAASGDAAEAMLATEGLERVGPSAAPSLVRVGKGSPHEQVRSRAGEALRGFGPKAMKALVAGVTPENSADLYPWFVELDRNWTLRSSSNPTFQALVTYHRGKLLTDLTAGDYQVREDAVKTLKLVGSVAKDTVPALVTALADRESRIRSTSAEALGEFGPGAQDAIPALVTALADKDRWVRSAAMKALGRIDPKWATSPPATRAIPALIAALADKEQEVRSSTAEALGGFGPGAKDAVPALVATLTDKVPEVRWTVARALGKIGPEVKDAVPALITALADRDQGVRWTAAVALGTIGPEAKDAIPALINALSDEDMGVRSSASEALGKMGPGAQAAIPALLNALVHKDVGVRRAAAEALGRIGPGAKDAIPALISALTDKESWVRQPVADALGKIGSEAKDALPALLAAVGDKEPCVREAAMEALGRIDPHWASSTLAARALPALLNALVHKDAVVRRVAAEALGRIGPGAKDAVPALIKALTDKESWVRQAAAAALRQIDRKWATSPLVARAIPELIKALTDNDEWVRRSAAEALGKIGPAAKDALNKLRELQAKDTDEGVKTEATRAIQLIEGNPTKP